MNRTVPITYKGRNVHLQRLQVSNAPPGEPTVPELWHTIHSVQGDGQWWAIAQTRGLDRRIIKKLRNALLNRHWYAGYDGDILTILATSMDGICFHWAYGKEVGEGEEVEAVRQERLKRRNRREATDNRENNHGSM